MISHFSGSLKLVKKLSLLTAIFALTFSASAQSAEEGKKLFDANCVSCHAIKEQVVGPALKDVHKRKDEAWLIKWIKNSQAVVKSGDAYAVELYNKYNQSVMTSFEGLSDVQVKSILAYVKQESEAAPAAVAASTGSESASSTAAAPATGANKQTKSRIHWLLVIIVSLLTVVIVQVFSILDTVGKIQGREVINWNKVNATLMLVVGSVGLILAVWEFVVHGKLTVNANTAASEHGVGIDKMFNITLFFTGVVFIITQIALFFFAFKYKNRKNEKAFFYSHNDKIEYIWTIVPAIVLTVLVINGLKYWNKIFTKPAEGTPKIEVFAYQFGWTARYPGSDKELGSYDFRQIGKSNALGVLPDDPKSADDFTSSEIHLPVNKPVTLKFRAKDVIHSAYLPHFRVQMNCVPGLPTEFTFTPTITTADKQAELGDPTFDYALLCNKICGSAHYRMKVKVIIDTEENYKKWVAEQKPAFAKKAEEVPAAAAPAEENAVQASKDKTGKKGFSFS
jgi:cytochrome c oxidase subunit 2